MRFGKKATEFGTATLVLLTIITFIWASLVLYNKIGGTNRIGDLQYKLINTYDNGEKVLFYIDESAKQASYKALNSLADNGGDAGSVCGKYFGSTLLVSKDKNCIPEDDNVKRNFESYFKTSLDKYLSKYTYSLNSEYSLSTDVNNKIIRGVAQSKIILPIGGTKIEQMKAPTQYFPTPGNFFSSPAKSNYITSCYGYRGNLGDVGEGGTQASVNHLGIDFRASEGENVYSVADGVVDSIDPNTWGRIVIDNGNGLKTSFMHLSTITKKAKDPVKKGDVIGTAGRRGPKGASQYTYVHLHFEVYTDKFDLSLKYPGTNIPVANKNLYGQIAVNPYCFFDSSTLQIKKLSSDTDQSCKIIYQGTSPINDAEQKFCDIYKQNRISIPEKIADTTTNQASQASQSPVQVTQVQQASNTAAVTLSSGAVSCQNADFSKISSTNLAKCYRYYAIFTKYIKENKLDVDPLLIMSLVSTESSCMNADELRVKYGSGRKADAGIMQVDEVCGVQKKCPDVDSQIREGMKIFKLKLDDVNSLGKELTQEEKMILLLYSYNRGGIGRIIAHYKSGLKLDDAIYKGCTEIYIGPADSATSRYDSNNKDKCNSDGYGVQYPKKIFSIYNNACTQIGGTAGGSTGVGSGQTYDSSSPSAVYGSAGEYSFTPVFVVPFDFDLNVYNTIFKTIRRLSDDYNSARDQKEFIDDITLNAKMISPSLLWQENCDEPDNKAFYAFAEGYTLCQNSVDSNCYCEIKLPKDLPDKSSLLIENTLSGLKLSNSYAEPETIDNKNVGLSQNKIDSLKINLERKSNTEYIIHAGASGSSVFSSTMGIFDYNLKADELFYIYKSGNLLSFIDTKSYENEKQKISQNQNPVCRLNKDTVKLCVRTQSEIQVLDKNNNVNYVKKDIKFAFTLKDLTPPPLVQEVVSPESKISQNESIIRWKQDDPKGETEKFVIFMSKKDLSGYTYDELEKMVSTGGLAEPVDKKEFMINNILRVSSIDFANPEIKLDKNVVSLKYKASPTDVKPILDSLYKIETKPGELYEFFSRISFKTSERYSAVIGAVDKFGNVRMKDEGQRTNLKWIDVKDSLPPATQPLPDFNFLVSANVAENKVTLSFPKPPALNIDGSKFDPDKELLRYDIYYVQGEMTALNFFTSSKLAVEKQYGSQEITGVDLSEKKKWCFYVVPVDINNQIQFNDNTKHLMDNANGKFFEPVCVGQ